MARFLLTHGVTAGAERSPEKEAVRFSGQALSYAELEAYTNSLARTLIEQGVKRGEVPRLSRLRSDAVVFWQAVTIGTGPVLTLIAGVVVWMLRRR